MNKKLNKQKSLILLNGILSFLLIRMIYQGFDSLSIHRTLTQSGEFAIWLLILTLACTPLFTVFGWKKPRRFKKSLGIFSFLFLLLHVTLFVGKNRWQLIEALSVMADEVNLILGLVSFILMLVLSLTSNKASIRKLGEKWKSLHHTVYLAAGLAVLHIGFIQDEINPHGFKYGIIIGLLLVLRIPIIKEYFVSRRNNRNRRKQTADNKKAIGMKPVFLLLVTAVLLTFVLALSFNHPAWASKKNRHDGDYKSHGDQMIHRNNTDSRGLFSSLFAPSILPVVSHDPTKNNCGGSCHKSHLPGLLPERSWKKIMNQLDNHFGEEVSLEPTIKNEIQQYLVTNSADSTDSRISSGILKSIGDQTPVRITETGYFLRKHDDIDTTIIQHESVKSLSNCQACHIGSSKTGSFDESDVRMP